MAKKSESGSRLKFTAEQLHEWTEVVEVGTLKPHPQNPNNGDQERLSASIDRHGQFEPKLISSDDYVLSGNHFYHDAMSKGGSTKIAVVRLPLLHDNPQALEIMLAANHITRKGKDDKGILEQLLVAIKEEQGEVVGAGFTDQELERLLQANSQDADSGVGVALDYKIVVDCSNEEHQVELLEKFEEMGLQCKALIA